MTPRKPIGVYMLVSGTPWMFCRERNIDEAMRTARTLRGGDQLPKYRVWLAPPPAIGRKRDQRSKHTVPPPNED